MYEVTVVYGAGKGEVMWPGPEIIVMIGLGVYSTVDSGLTYASRIVSGAMSVKNFASIRTLLYFLPDSRKT